MNNILTNTITLLLLLTLYGITYRAVSAGFRALSKHRDTKKAAQENLLRNEAIKQALFTLSRDEIAILKFILAQNSYIAWLPTHFKHVLLLKKKGIICLFSGVQKEISRQSMYYSDFTSHAQMFSIPDNVQNILTQIKQDVSKKWRKIKPEYSLGDLQ